MAGPRRLGEAAAEAVEARAPTRVTLRPFAPFSAAAPADEGGCDWSFIDCEMEEVDLQDLPSATIACHLDPRVFVDGLCRVRTARPAGRRADTCCRARPGRGRAATLLPGVAGSEGGLPSAPPTWSRSRSEYLKSVPPLHGRGWLLLPAPSPSQSVKIVRIREGKGQVPAY